MIKVNTEVHIGDKFHVQAWEKCSKNLFDQELPFSEYIMKLLKQNWAGYFYRLIFTQFNEERFSILYSEKASRANTPVNQIVSLPILKQ